MVTSEESRQRGSKRDSGQEKGLLLVSQYTMQLNFDKNAVMLLYVTFWNLIYVQIEYLEL